MLYIVVYSEGGRRPGGAGSALIDGEALTSPGLAANGATRHMEWIGRFW
jgi:hypothetical protein